MRTLTNEEPHTNSFTAHAIKRMDARGINSHTVANVLTYGRILFARGAVIYVVGKKEVQKYRKKCPLLAELEGITVICLGDGMVLTTYRNQNLRALRSCRRFRGPQRRTLN